jgi:transposase InsO family protein
MPWKETNVVTVRTEFVVRAMENKIPFIALCQEYGISTKTGYKWKERFLAKGISGLSDQSRRPHSSPARITEDQACRLIRLKLAHRRWGPKKIHDLFIRQHSDSEALSLSTVKRILDKSGLVEHRARRKVAQCGRIENRIEAKSPNEVWTVDFKGWWYSVDKARIEPLTVRDAYSRYILCADVLEDGKSQTVQRCFERLFEMYGLPKTIRSDNGSPFACTRSPLGLSRLSAWWVALGINLDRIAPGHPEQNGGHERMHRDIAYEIEGCIDGDVCAHQAALETWRHEFNHERPHEALEMRVPANLYAKSERTFDPKGFELSYPQGYLSRRVGNQGCVMIRRSYIFISGALSGWDIGLKTIAYGRYAVWFGLLCLGEIDMETESFHAA